MKKNDYLEKDDHYEFYITQRNGDEHTFLISKEDFDEVSKFRWCMSHGYVVSWVNDEVTKIHKFILNPPKGILIDHINHNKLDNRRENLRFVTNQQNLMNMHPHQNCSSKYKGVALFKSTGKFMVQICIDGKNKFCGYFKNELDAAVQYDNTAKELFGVYAYLNEEHFPEILTYKNKQGELNGIN